MSSLDALEKRINQLDGSLSKFSKAVLTDETRFSRIKKGIFYSNIDRKWVAHYTVYSTMCILLLSLYSVLLGITGVSWEIFITKDLRINE